MTTRNKILLFPYFVMIVAGLMVPSDGNHGFFSIKSLSFLSSCLFVGTYAAWRQKYRLSQLRLLTFFVLSLTFAMTWLFIGLIRDTTTAAAIIDQFKILLITLLVPVSTLFLIHDGILTPQQFFRAVIYASFCYAAIKVLCVALHILHIMDLWTIMENLGFRYMRMGIYGGLERVQTSVDIVTPFLAFFVLQSDHLGLHFHPRFKKAFVIVGLLSTFLSFSRYLIGIFLLSLIFYWATLNIPKMAKITAGVIIIIGCGFWVVGLDAVWAVIERRLLSPDNFLSDFTRYRQVDALMTEFWQVPMLGKGLGGYAPAYIRDTVLLHSYEVQWVAFLMQFGFLGILGLLFPCLLIAVRLVQGQFSRLRWSFLGIFLLWLISGFTNPFLISLTSGIMYTMFWLSGTVLSPRIERHYPH